MRQAKSAFPWKPAVSTAVLVFSLVTVLEASTEFDAYEFLYLVSIPIVVLLLIVWSLARKSLAAVVVVMAYCASSWIFFKEANQIRDTALWLLKSKALKAMLEASPSPKGSALKHVEWYRSGFAGIGTTPVYLAFDPTDKLRDELSLKSASRLPCTPFRVFRLEREWYSVHFYADTSWQSCSGHG